MKSMGNTLQMLYKSLHVIVLVIVITVISFVIAHHPMKDLNTISNAFAYLE